MTNIILKGISAKKVGKKAVKIMLGVLAVLLVCVIILVGLLMAWSPGTPMPIPDGKGGVMMGSLSEKIHMPVNGAEQGMFIRGANKDNPVLLFVHGGPGMPEYFMEEKYPTGLENHFTVCYWEQRGAGLSYDSGISPETLTMEQLVNDTVTVTDYLRERFGKDKIYLMGHSWGTTLGILAAARAPEKYNAYIGISQCSLQLESEKLAYNYMVEQYTAAGNTQMVQKLKEYAIQDSDEALEAYSSSPLRDQVMHDLGIGTMRNMKSVITGIFLPVMQCRAYTLGEKINLWRAKAFLNRSTNLRKQMLETDFSARVPELKIPAYFFGGINDYTVFYTLAKQYLKRIKAPVKGFYTFNQSAHSPLFEEPDQFLHIILEDVLNQKSNLSDK